jgi:hypothetical protein
MTLTYDAKVRLVKYLLPLVVIIPCALVGAHSAGILFAETPTPSGFSVTVSQPVYHVSQVVTVTLTNTSAVNEFIVNNCPHEPLAVYRLTNNRWQRITATTTLTTCVGQPSTYELPAGSNITTDYRHWPSLFSQPGDYRIVFTPEFYTHGVSTQFKVVS